MKDEEVLTVCKRINKYLGENNFHHEVYPYGLDMPVVECEIHWGDWKHDHLRLKWLMEEIGAHFITTRLDEENGSDCYSATHWFMVDEEILKGVA